MKSKKNNKAVINSLGSFLVFFVKIKDYESERLSRDESHMMNSIFDIFCNFFVGIEDRKLKLSWLMERWSTGT